MLKQFVVVFTAVLLAAAVALFAYDRWVVAPRLAALGETERIDLESAREEAARIAGELEASVDRSVEQSRVALDGQVAEVERLRAAAAADQQAMVATFRGRARIVEALARASSVKVGVAEYRMSEGDWPRDLAAAGLGAPDDHAGGPVAAIDLEPGGVIAIRLRDDVAPGGVIRLHPEPNRAGVISWHCRTQGVEPDGAGDCE